MVALELIKKFEAFRKGIGPVTAYKLIKEHKTIEAVIQHLEHDNQINTTKKKKYVIPKEFIYDEARELFLNPKIEDAANYEVFLKKNWLEFRKKDQMEQTGWSRIEEILGWWKRVLRGESGVRIEKNQGF